MLLILTGCARGGLRLDPSPAATKSNDMTLITALSDGPCRSMPGQGGDICRFRRGAPIESSWRIVVPFGKDVGASEVTINFKDHAHTYAPTGPVIEVPLRDLIGHEVWEDGDATVITALAKVKFNAEDGFEHTLLAEGVALIIVLPPGYDPLPIDSGVGLHLELCEVEYSSAGRSALSCGAR